MKTVLDLIGELATLEEHWPVGSRLTLYLTNIVRGP